MLYIMRLSLKERGKDTQMKSTGPQPVPKPLLLFSEMILTQFSMSGKGITMYQRGAEEKRDLIAS